MQMMQETLLIGTARKAELPGWQAAGKTGTSQDWRDAWFLGYTSYLVAGVWLGNDDNSPTKKVSGGNLPVEIWSRFMRAAHRGRPGRRPAGRDLARRRGAEPGRFAVAAARPHQYAEPERRTGGTPAAAGAARGLRSSGEGRPSRDGRSERRRGAASASRHPERRPRAPAARQGAPRQAVRHAVRSGPRQGAGLPRRRAGANLVL